MCLVWGEARCFLYNDAYSVFLGERHPRAFGAAFEHVWADIWDDIEPLYRRAMAGETITMKDMPLSIIRDGQPQQTWWSFSYSPVRDESASVQGMLNVASETTAQVLADRRAAAEHERLGQMLREMPGFVARLSGPDHRFDYVNDAFRMISGERQVLGRNAAEAFPELVEQGFLDLLNQVYASGTAFTAAEMPVSILRVDGDRYIDLLYQPVRDDAGQVNGIFVGGYDVTDHVRTRQRLQASEARYRTLFQAIDAGFCIVEVELNGPDGRIDYRVVEANPAFFTHTGFPEAIMNRWLREAAPGLEEHWFEIYGQVARTRQPLHFEERSDLLGRDLPLSFSSKRS